MTDTSKDKVFSDWATDRLIRSVIGGLRLMPYNQRIASMDWITRSIIGKLTRFQSRAERHLALVYPELPEDACHALAQRALGNTGRTIIELYSGAQFTKRCAKSEISGEGLEAIARAKRDGQPVVFVTGHFGNHEAPRHALAQMGYPIGGLYRPMSNRFFNSHYVETMRSLNAPLFEQGSGGARAFLKHLNQGGMATLLFDVWVKGGEPINFMGHSADTSLAAAQLAQRSGALVVPYFGIRKPDGVSFDIRIEAPLEEGAPADMMRAATQRLEHHIHAHPEQYFWVHRRWKPLT